MFKLDIITPPGHTAPDDFIKALMGENKVSNEWYQYHIDIYFYEMLANSFHKANGNESSLYFHIGFNYALQKAYLKVNSINQHIYNKADGSVYVCAASQDIYMLDESSLMTTEEALDWLNKIEGDYKSIAA